MDSAEVSNEDRRKVLVSACKSQLLRGKFYRVHHKRAHHATNTNRSKDTRIEDSRGSDSMWSEAMRLSQYRKDCYHPCAICHQDFKLRPQVILSCSHVFHKACLFSFEKLLDNNKQRRCPLCREEGYEKRDYNHGIEVYKLRSCVKIQSFWRMILCQERCEQLFRQQSSLTTCHTFFKRRITLRRLALTNRVMKKEVHDHEQRVRDALMNADMAISFSRSLFGSSRDICAVQEFIWSRAKSKAIERGIFLCCICREEAGPSLHKTSFVVLPCSHVLHSKCLESFECFFENYADSEENSRSRLCCPLCRAPYLGEKMFFTENDF